MRKVFRLMCVLLVISLLTLPVVGCAKPLTLTMTTPMDGRTFDQPQVEVRANVSDAKATVWVNDSIVTVKKYSKGGGWFSTKVDLNEGENTIKVTAARGYKKGTWKEVVDRTVTVTYSPK